MRRDSPRNLGVPLLSLGRLQSPLPIPMYTRMWPVQCWATKFGTGTPAWRARALDAGIPCAWVLADPLYGSDSRLRRVQEARPARTSWHCAFEPHAAHTDRGRL